VGTFPFNSFLSGFLSCVGMFALTGACVPPPSTAAQSIDQSIAHQTPNHHHHHHYHTTVSLRLQVSSGASGKGAERAFGEYVFSCLLLFLVVMNFIG
jgi:hypothetical protein